MTDLDLLRGALEDPARVLTRPLDRHAAAHDASHVLLIPQAVVRAESAAEIARLLRGCSEHRQPVTFRSGGTSLSGQAVSDEVLVDVRRGFRRLEVLDGGTRIRVQPGMTVRAVNAALARYGRTLGPDPASEVACTIGGVIANNSSGMTCGIRENTYRTLESLTLVLASGTVIDTGAADADARLRALEPALHDGLLALARRVRESPAAAASVRRQFSRKNTMGYGLNSLLDFDSPAEILAHLVVGSEGTLGFVAEAVLRTVPLRPHAATALLVLPDLATANEALPALVESRAATVELLDALSLRVGQAFRGAPAAVRDLDVHEHAALLVEYAAEDEEQLADLAADGEALLPRLGLAAPAAYSRDAGARAQLWTLRKGLYAAVAGARPAGTTALLEDVAVPVPALGRTCRELTGLFARHGYRDGVIFGHAKDGNIHFMLTDGFVTDASLERYRDFTEDLVDLILGEGGSLKAEHGTGRVMAPFVRRQYGDELYQVMREIKQLFDPAGVLNPGVLLDEDPEAHLRHIKTVPPVAQEVDRCVSCGYCEPVCPSRDLTLTPRQRIVTLRAIEAARRDGDEQLARRLEEDYDYASVQTCAVDGMCETACPVGINTGALVKRLRGEEAGPVAGAVWSVAARGWGGAARGAARALDLAHRLPPGLVGPPNAAARRVLGAETVPLHTPDLPSGGASRRRPEPAAAPDAVLFLSCTGTMFAPADGGDGVQLSLEALCARAGITLRVPAGIDGLCCGTPWSSKGMGTGLDTMRERTVAALLDASEDGALPIVCDASSCTEGLLAAVEAQVPGRLRIVDAIAFVAERVLPHLLEATRLPLLALHPTCSSTRLGIGEALAAVAGAVAETVEIPLSWGCCAFAGDRGMLHPELTASATARQAEEVRAMDATAHASCNRTCEIGMTRATGSPYRHVLELLEERTRP